jgi:hypothetical protein
MIAATTKNLFFIFLKKVCVTASGKKVAGKQQRCDRNINVI